MTTAAVATHTSGWRGTPWWVPLVQGIILLVLGILLLTAPGMTTAVLAQFVGVFLLIDGVVRLISLFVDASHWGWKLVAGIAGILAGLYVVQHPLWSGLVVPGSAVYVVGFASIVVGITGIVTAVLGGGLTAGVLGAVGVLVGLGLLLSPLITVIALPLVIGAIAVVGGVITIIGAIRLR